MKEKIKKDLNIKNMDFFNPDILDLINLEIYEEFNTKGLTDFQALKKYSNNLGKTALYLINKKDCKKTGALSVFLLSHLSIELYLKSLISLERKKIPTIHDLGKMLSILPSNMSLSEDIKNKILAINKIGINGFGFRYPMNKKGKKYKNFKIKFLPELNYSESFKENNTTTTRGTKQSSVKNYLQLISDIEFVLKSFI